MKKLIAFVLIMVLTLSTCLTAVAAEPTQEELLAQYYEALAKKQGNVKDAQKQIENINTQIESIRGVLLNVDNLYGSAVNDPQLAPLFSEMFKQYGNQIVELDKQLKALGADSTKSSVVNGRTVVYPNVMYKSDRIVVPFKVECRDEAYVITFVMIEAKNKGKTSTLGANMFNAANVLIDNYTDDLKKVKMGKNGFYVAEFGFTHARKYKNNLKTIIFG